MQALTISEVRNMEGNPINAYIAKRLNDIELHKNEILAVDLAIKNTSVDFALLFHGISGTSIEHC